MIKVKEGRNISDCRKASLIHEQANQHLNQQKQSFMAVPHNHVERLDWSLQVDRRHGSLRLVWSDTVNVLLWEAALLRRQGKQGALLSGDYLIVNPKLDRANVLSDQSI